jgi:hypothetical protein
MTRHTTAICFGLVLLFAPWIVSPCHADTTTVILNDYAVIVPEGQTEPARVLFGVNLPNAVSGKRIDFAELSFGISSLPGPYLEIEVYPLSRSWTSNSVTWASPWQNAGGDFDDSDLNLVAITGGESPRGHADVTEIVSSWVNGERSNHGIILVCSKEFPGNFRLVLGNQQSPVKLEVRYSERD